MMNIEKDQINLLRKRRGERWENTPLWPTRDNLKYLRRFLFQQKRLSVLAFVTLFLQGIFEICLIAVSHRYLKTSADFSNSFSNQYLFLIICLLSALYLFSYFVSIKSARTLIIRLINSLRLKWFKLSLHRDDSELDLESKGIFLAKMSYHLPLLSTGITNSLLGAIQWLLLIIILIFLSFIFGFRFLWLLLPAIILSLLVGILAFFVSKNYVSRETTFYSRIIKLADFSLSDWHYTKLFHREKAIENQFSYLVNLDSYFRVRRDIWLRFSGGILFVLLIFASWALNIFNKPIGSFFASSATDLKFTLVIFIIYFSRLLYESMRVGLYGVPFLLGLDLSVPRENPKKLNREIKFNFKQIIFKATKTKFFKKDDYHKNLNFKFTTGGRYLISGPHRAGKTALARLFSGLANYGRRTWIIKANDRRYFYNEFFDKYSGFYYINPNFTSQRTLLEVVTGKEKEGIDNTDFIRIIGRINEHPELQKIFFEKDDWRLKSFKSLKNTQSVLLLQVLYCLEKKPLFIALDNFWLDYDDPETDSLLQLLARLLPKSIILFFATKPRTILPYDNTYEI